MLVTIDPIAGIGAILDAVVVEYRRGRAAVNTATVDPRDWSIDRPS